MRRGQASVQSLTLTWPESHVNSRFGWAIEIMQLHLRKSKSSKEAGLQRGIERFSTTHHLAQAVAAFQVSLSQKGLEHSRNKMQHSHGLLDHEGFKISTVLVTTWGCDDQVCSRSQGQKKLPDGDVETEGRFLQDPIPGCELIGLLHPGKAITDSAMAVHNPFRLARRTRCINQICQIVRLHRVGRIASLI